MKKLIDELFIKKTKNTYIQFFRYFFVGGFAAVANISILYIFTSLIHLYYILSNVLGFVFGLIINYILSKKFVFTDGVKINKKKEFTIYLVIGILGLLLDSLILWLCTSVFGIYYLISKIISTFIVFIWNFGARKILYIIMEVKK